MTVGKTTMLLAQMNEGEYIMDLLGPLGKKSEIENFGKSCLCWRRSWYSPGFPHIKRTKKKGELF